jgi:putative ABC transport system ATP-binding protein
MNIQLKNIKPTYMSEAEIAASDIYLQEKVVFKKGEKYLIKANSGHGKSSILNFIYGSNLNYDGSITYDEEYDTIFNLRKTKLSYVFQDFKLFSDLTVFENIQLKNKLTNYKTAKEIDCLIAEVLLEHKRDSLVKNLSLGQRQRVAIIRALCQPFDFLLLDEPFSHLDSTNINILSTILNKELAFRNAGVIVTALEEINYFKFDRIINL